MAEAEGGSEQDDVSFLRTVSTEKHSKYSCTQSKVIDLNKRISESRQL